MSPLPVISLVVVQSTSTHQTAPWWPLNVPSRSPFSENQTEGLWSLAVEKIRSPSRLYLICVMARSCPCNISGFWKEKWFQALIISELNCFASFAVAEPTPAWRFPGDEQHRTLRLGILLIPLFPSFHTNSRHSISEPRSLPFPLPNTYHFGVLVQVLRQIYTKFHQQNWQRVKGVENVCDERNETKTSAID